MIEVESDARHTIDVEFTYVDGGVLVNLTCDLTTVDGRLRAVPGDGCKLTLLLERPYAEKLLRNLEEVLAQ